MKIELQLSEGSIIAPKQIDIEGYHIIGKDDKLVITIPDHITQNEYEKIGEMLEEFYQKDGQFLLLSSGHGITVLRKGDDK